MLDTEILPRRRGSVGTGVWSPERARLAVESGIFARWQARLAGYTDRDVLRAIRGGRLVRLDVGVYTRAGREPAEPDGFRYAVARLGPTAALAHASAAQALGIELVTIAPIVTVAVPRGHRRNTIEKVTVLRRRTRAGVVWPVALPLPVTPAIETVLDLADLPLAHAVAAADSALRQRIVESAELVRQVELRRYWVGYPAIAAMLRHIDARAGSVAESIVRVELVEAGLPGAVSQFVILESGRRYIVDFAWPMVKLVLEVDGYAVHATPEAFNADRVRQNILVEAGWTVLRVTGWDALNRPDMVVTLVARALSRRGLPVG
jgi:very-short-patch-repair endonuclease